MYKSSQWITRSFLFVLASSSCFALSPAATEQSVLNLPRQQASIPVKTPVKKPARLNRELTTTEKERIKKLFNSPAFKALIMHYVNAHPDFSATAKSVYSPAAVPFQWGGIGLASDTVSRYPSQHHVDYKSGLSAAIPFGDSESSIGGVLSFGTAQLQPLSPPSSLTRFGH